VKQKTDAERRTIVGEWRQSRDNEERFCRRKGISLGSLKRWTARFGGEVTASFLPVTMIAEELGAVGRESSCRIFVGSHVVIECSEHSSERSIEKALRAAVAACCPNSER
jgi:hypothetical protein